MVELLADTGADVEWTGPNEVRVHAAGPIKTELDEELCTRIRASFLLAGPLLAREGRAVVPPPGGDVIGRRRLDTHIHAFQQLGAEIELDAAASSMRASRLVGRAALPRRGERDGHRERGDGRRARRGRDRDRERGLRAARPGSLPLPRLAGRARSTGSARTCSASPASSASHGGEHRIGPEHIEVASFIGLAAVTGGDMTIEGIEPTDLISILPVFEKLGVARRARRHEPPRAARPGARDPGRPRRPDPEGRGRPLARVPRRPHLDRAHRRDAGARHDPDLREDVREPPLLRRQARRDGRRGSSSATRTAPSSPAPRGSTASGWRAPTSAPGWRC